MSVPSIVSPFITEDSLDFVASDAVVKRNMWKNKGYTVPTGFSLVRTPPILNFREFKKGFNTALKSACKKDVSVVKNKYQIKYLANTMIDVLTQYISYHDGSPPCNIDYDLLGEMTFRYASLGEKISTTTAIAGLIGIVENCSSNELFIQPYSLNAINRWHDRVLATIEDPSSLQIIEGSPSGDIMTVLRCIGRQEYSELGITSDQYLTSLANTTLEISETNKGYGDIPYRQLCSDVRRIFTEEVHSAKTGKPREKPVVVEKKVKVKKTSRVRMHR